MWLLLEELDEPRFCSHNKTRLETRVDGSVQGATGVLWTSLMTFLFKFKIVSVNLVQSKEERVSTAPAESLRVRVQGAVNRT